MSNQLSSAFKASVQSWLVNSYNFDVAEIVGWEEEIRNGGGCETCAYTETVVLITWTDYKGNPDSYTYYGSFAELVNALIEM